MKVSLDGGQTYLDVDEGVRVIYEDCDFFGNDLPGELHVNLTHEGIIVDAWCFGANENSPIGTESRTLNEIIDGLQVPDPDKESE